MAAGASSVDCLERHGHNAHEDWMSDLVASLDYLQLTEDGAASSSSLAAALDALSTPAASDKQVVAAGEQASSVGAQDDSWICAICLDKMELAEYSQIKGCEHSHCVTCILRWASTKENPWCPQCRKPFSMLYVYRAIDGSLRDYMVEETVCFLLRAPWYRGMPEVEEPEAEEDDYGAYDYDEDEEIAARYALRLGNRRWGENGFVRGGRMEARPKVVQPSSGASGSGGPRNKAAGGANPDASAPSGNKALGRRAKRAQQRQTVDQSQATAGKHRRGGRR